MRSRVSAEAFARLFGRDDGILPNGVVVDSSRADWSSVIRAVEGQGWAITRTHAEWDNAVTSADELIRLLVDYPGGPDAPVLSFAVYPIPGVRVNFFPDDPEEVWFDLDRRELANQWELDAMCQFVEVVARATEHEVRIAYEGVGGSTILEYSPHSDVWQIIDPTTGSFDVAVPPG
jgi:hypothetical protein